MGYKCSFAERVVSTAQRLANCRRRAKIQRRGSVCGGGGGCCRVLQRKRSNRNSLLEEEHVSTRT